MSMKGYESVLFDNLNETSRNMRVQDVQDVLGLGIGSSGQVVTWRPKDKLSAVECSRMCSVISAYRLLDIIAMLRGANPAPRLERRFFELPNKSFRVSSIITIASTLKYLQGMDKLAHWPTILTRFRDVLKKSTRTSTLPPQILPGPVRLMRLIARNDSSNTYNAIEANFLHAAMHIACMKELRFQSGICPDLPEDIEAVIRS